MKVRRVLVTPELITEMLTTGYKFNAEIVVTDGLPEGSVLTAVGWDATSRTYALDFHHPTFEEIYPPALFPIISLTIQKKASILNTSLSRDRAVEVEAAGGAS
jgi:hypothetical protein